MQHIVRKATVDSTPKIDLETLSDDQFSALVHATVIEAKGATLRASSIRSTLSQGMNEVENRAAQTERSPSSK